MLHNIKAGEGHYVAAAQRTANGTGDATLSTHPCRSRKKPLYGRAAASTVNDGLKALAQPCPARLAVNRGLVQVCLLYTSCQ